MGELITRATEETTSAENLAALIPRGVWTSIGASTLNNMSAENTENHVTTPEGSETQVSDGVPRSGAGGAQSLASYSTQSIKPKQTGKNSKSGGEKRPKDSSSEELSPKSKAEEKQRKLRQHKTRKILDSDKPQNEKKEGKQKNTKAESTESKKDLAEKNCVADSDDDMDISDSEDESENETDRESTITEVEPEKGTTKQVQHLNELVASIRSGFRTREVKTATDALSELQCIILQLMVDWTRVRTQNKELKTQITELQTKSKTEQRPAPTYSAVTSENKVYGTKSTKRLKIDSNAMKVIIKPKEKDKYKNSEDLRKAVKETLSPGKQQIQIRRFIVRKEDIVLETNSVATLEKLKTSRRLQTKFEVTEPTKFRPRIIIYDVPSEYTEQDLKAHVFKQNDFEMELGEFEQSFTPKFKTGKRDRPVTNWVAEVSPGLRRKIMQNRRLYLEWTSCRALDFVLVTRCFKCQGFGHIGRNCKNKEICSLCATEGHNNKTCPDKADKNKARKCANCARAKKASNHNVMDRKCPCYVRALERLTNNTDYNGTD